jgi:AtzE family amidohydrolase
MSVNLSMTEQIKIVRDVASGDRSATEVLETSLAHIESTNKKVNAFTGLSLGRARGEALAIDQRRARGEKLPPLAGLPYAVKNLYDIEGEVTLAGSKINVGNRAARADAVLVQRLKAAGAVLVGSLNMDEYAYGFTTENTHYGPSHNPHDLSRIAGGSSGGSGAAVAAGQVPLALGTDTNGSIRVPASLCGVWGLKPTFGRLSRRGTYPFVHNLDHVGPLANSCSVLAASYDAMQGPDALDPGCHAVGVHPTWPSLGKGLAGLRIAQLGGYFTDNTGPEAIAALSSAATHLGAVEQINWPDAGLARIAAFIMTASEGGGLHLEDLRRRLNDFEPLSVDRFLSGALQPSAWYVQAQRFRRVYRDKVNELFKHWDILLAPATPICATPIGTEWIELNGQRQFSRAAMGLLTQPISFAGCPVVVAPMWPNVGEGLVKGDQGGLPMGVQIIAAPWREDLALRAAFALEQAGVAHAKAPRHSLL